METINHFINGKEIEDSSATILDIYNPTLGKVIRKVGCGNNEIVDKAVKAAKEAQKDWANQNPQKKSTVFFNFLALLHENMDELAHTLSEEHGKTIADAKGDLRRGMDVVEFACGLPHLLKGEYSENVASSIDVYSMKQPLGIGAGISPFNFPAMIPMWMFTMAIACGNSFILKPSEKDPSVPLKLCKLMQKAGLPDGVLNMVNGGKEVVDAILHHKDISAVSFVGSSKIADYIYSTACANSKRVQAFGGAKNHLIIMPDADMENVTKQLVGSAFGSAGERCMATPVVVPVGDDCHKKLIDSLLPKIDNLKIGSSFDETSDYGPVVTQQHKDSIINWVNIAEQEGAKILVDGRNYKHPEYDGFFIGPCLIDDVTENMKSYQEEIFGPVLQIVKAKDFTDAVRLPSEHQYGNGVAIFTKNGTAAREFAREVKVGMVGINVPIPVPVSYHTFGGWKRSVFGDINQHGMDGIKFWTKTKTITQRWSDQNLSSDFTIPTTR